MKSLLPVCLALLIATASHAQSPTMVVTMEDGSETRILVSDIQSLRFTQIELPEYRAMGFEPHRMSDAELDNVYPKDIDSVFFTQSSVYWAMMFATLPGVENYNYSGIDVTRNWDTKLSFYRHRKNPNMTTGSYPHVSHEPVASAWSGQTLYATTPMRKITLDSGYNWSRETILGNWSSNGLSISADGSTALTHTDKLIEFDLAAKKAEAIVDSISPYEAVYITDTKDFNFIGEGLVGWGFYRYNRSTEEAVTLMPYSEIKRPYSILTAREMSPDGVHALIGYWDTANRTTGVSELNLITKTMRDLPMQTKTPVIGLKYNKSGDRFAYGSMRWYSQDRVNEVGIVDIATGEKQIIDAAPDTEFGWEVTPMGWSPDDKAISLSVIRPYNPFSYLPESYYYYLYVLSLK